MIDRLKKKDLYSILDYCVHNKDNDFYLTEQNERKFFNSVSDIKKLFKCHCLFGSINEKGDVEGIAIIWKSLGNNIIRHYLKITAQNEKIGERILKVLLWNFGHYELYIKINKQNRLLTTLKIHGFKFAGDRGKEILLKKDKFLRPEKQQSQKDINDGSE